MDLDLEGWVANERDGSVRCVAEGPRDRIDAFLARLRAGPPAALVTASASAGCPPVGELGPFAISSGGHQGD